jgi:transcriptional regulator with XRE-family HTH domain/tetratricopeptide (TPR) repeat protein
MKPHLLKAEREKYGWSLVKLATMLGTTARTVSRWEQGLAIPYPYYREQLCTLYEKTAEELGLIPDDSDWDDRDTVEETISPISELFGSRTACSGLADQIANKDGMLSPSFFADSAIPQIENLVGRTGFLIQLKECLLRSSPSTLVALSGLPGVGKTSLAVALATDQQVQAHFYDGILWTTLGPHPNVLAQLARWGGVLGIEPTEVEDITSRESWGQALRAVIGHCRMLLIIDDVWSAETALAFRIGGTQCAHLLTTRMPQVAFAFAQEGAFTVPELTEGDGVSLLTSFAPQLMLEHAQAEALALVRRVGSLPLALTLMGKYLGSQAFTGQPRRLQAALTQLQDTQQRLHVSMPIPLKQRSPSLPGNMPISLNAAISISDQQLNPQAHDTLCALSVFPAKPNTFSEEAALTVSQQPVEMLDTLWDAGLLESQGPRRYTLPQTIADYARTRLQGSQAPQLLVNYMLEYIQNHEQDYKALDLEMNNLLAALDAASTLHMRDALIQGVTALVPFMRIRGLYAQASYYLRLALRLSTALEDQIGCMTVLRHLAAFACLSQEYSQAEAYSQHGLALAQDLGQIEAESDFLIVLGQVAFHRTHYALATTLYEQGLQLSRQLGTHIGISTLLCSLGKDVSCYQDNYCEAESLYQEGLTIAQRRGDQELIAVTQYGLAQVVAQCGDVKEARYLGEQCLARFADLGHYQTEEVRGWLHSLDRLEHVQE